MALSKPQIRVKTTRNVAGDWTHHQLWMTDPHRGGLETDRHS
jgi:hypothetical protein